MADMDKTVQMHAIDPTADTAISEDGVVVEFDTGATRHELKSAPGAWVELRAPSHAEVLKRQGMLMTMRMQVTAKRRNEGMVLLDKDNLTLAAYDYKTCVVRHNLRRKGGRLFDLSNPVELQSLSTKVGQELDNLIGKLMEFDEDEEGKSSET